MRGKEEDVFGAEAFVQPAGSVELEDCFCQAEGDFEAAFEGDEGLAGDEATEGFLVPVEDLFRLVVIVVIREFFRHAVDDSVARAEGFVRGREGGEEDGQTFHLVDVTFPLGALDGFPLYENLFLPVGRESEV